MLKAWAGLGYYARARNLHACAQAVAAQHGGQFPGHRRRACARCPASAAIPRRRSRRSRSTGARSPIDGNIERVIARLFAIESRIAGGEDRNSRARRDAGAAAPRRRLRPGDDGPRRNHLHAEEAGLRHLPLDGMPAWPARAATPRRFRARRRRSRAGCATARRSSSCAPTGMC